MYSRCKIFLFAIWMLIVAGSCSYHKDIPLPQTETGASLPKKIALHVTSVKKFSWPDSFHALHPVIKKINLDKLPAKLFDSAGFAPMPEAPATTHFNPLQLRDTTFYLDSLAVEPLGFESILLPPPQRFKATSLHQPNNAFNILSAGDPFANTIIHNVLQDRNGFLWIVADHKLYRYDGENADMYVQVPQTSNVFAMKEDHEGRIWMCMIANNGNAIEKNWRGLAVLDPAAGLLLQPKSNSILGKDFFVSVYVDKNDRVWLGGLNNYIRIADLAANQVKTLDHEHGFPEGFVTGIVSDDNDNIWMASLHSGLVIANPEANKLSYLDMASGLSSDSVTGIYKGRHQIWAGFTSESADAIQEDSNASTIDHYIFSKDKNRSLIWSFSQNNEDYIWTGSLGLYDAVGDGIKLINIKKRLARPVTKESGLPSNNIFKLMSDRAGQVWAPTDNGLAKMRTRGNEIHRVGKENISCMIEDDKGRVWIGSTGNGVEIVEPDGIHSHVFTKKAGLSDDFVQNFYTHEGKVIICTNAGVDIIDSSLTYLSHYDHDGGFRYDSASSMQFDNKDIAWYCSFSPVEHGIELVDFNKNTTAHFPAVYQEGDGRTADICKDQSGRIWTMNFTGAVNIIDPARQLISRIDNFPGLKGKASVFMVDEDGSMWVGTSSGIWKIDPGLDSMMLISQQEGLIDNAINSLHQRGNEIYVGTSHGLSIVTTPDSPGGRWVFENWGRNQNITKNANSYNSDLLTRNGEFWWGDRGITIIKTNSMDTLPGKTYLQGISILNEEVVFANKRNNLPENDTVWSLKRDTFFTNGFLPGDDAHSLRNYMKWDSVEGTYNLPVNLVIPYDENYLQFRFGQAHLGTLDTTWYRYILLGIDKKWSARTNVPFSENYLNLPAGYYTFKVSSLYRGKWQEPASFSFRIAPPWWQTWWAYVLYALTLALVIIMTSRYRSRRLQKENARLEQKVNQRTTELRSSLENLQKAQNQLIQSEKMASLGELTAGIAHEIQNPLNFVNNFSEVNTELIDELIHGPLQKLTGEDKNEATALLKDIADNEKKINHHGKRADAIVKGMLQHSRSSSGQKELTDINALADEYLRLSFHGLRAKDKNFNASLHTHFDESIGKIEVIPQDIGRVLLNIYNNAFFAVAEKKKNAPADYHPEVWVTTLEKNGEIDIYIRDNGNGIPQKIMDKIFQPFFTTKPTGQGTGLGLSLSYDIITKAHGGDIWVDTKEGEYTEFVIRLPVKQS